MTTPYVTRTPTVVLVAVVALAAAALMAILSPLFSGLLIVPALTVAAIFGYKGAKWAPIPAFAGTALLALMALVNVITVATSQQADSVIFGVIGFLWVGANTILAGVGSALLLTPQARHRTPSAAAGPFYPSAPQPAPTPTPWQPTPGPAYMQPQSAPPADADAWRAAEADYGWQHETQQGAAHLPAPQPGAQGQGSEDLKRVGRVALAGAGLAAAGLTAAVKARQEHKARQPARPPRRNLFQQVADNRENARRIQAEDDAEVVRRVQAKQARQWQRNHPNL